MPISTPLFSASLFHHAHLTSPPPSSPPPFSFDSPLPPVPSSFPVSKIIPGTRFLVDSFRSPADFSVSYFLSHFHSDHYSGLSHSWRHGIVYCSPVTARLLIDTLLVPPSFVVPLSLGVTHFIDGCEVTAIDANHCPGAVQFLFKVPCKDRPEWERYVHTGDFRYCDSMKLDSNLQAFIGADAVFLDTTYCNPKFTFPLQEASVDYIASTIEQIMLSESVLFLLSTYVVGKERILLEVSRRCKCMIHVDARKMGVLHALGYDDPTVFTEDATATNVHVVGWNMLGETWPYFRPNFVKMKEIVAERGYSRGVGFVPTGWMYQTKKDGFAVRVKDSLEIHLVPYSEHSSYSELREYVGFLRPKRVIPTVGIDIEKLDSKHAVAMRKHFANLVDETANKQDFLMNFRKGIKEIDKACGDNLVTGQGEEIKEVIGPPLEAVGLRQEKCAPVTDAVNSYLGETIEELHGCLPSWVTREQVLELLTCSKGDMVEAVSTFYERETELFEQASTSVESASLVTRAPTSQSGLVNVIVKPDSSNPPTLGEKRLIDQNFIAGKINSPRNRGQVVGCKPNKRRKSCSTLKLSESSKQSVITNFFNKVTNIVSSTCHNFGPQHLNVDIELDVKGTPSDDPNEKNIDQVDHFLQIIDGGMCRRSANSLLGKAKGNINIALDMYYGNSHKNEDQPISFPEDSPCNNLVEIQDKLPTGMQDVAILSTLGDSVNGSSASSLALPPEKYSPINHACWTSGQPAPYLHLARTFFMVEQEKGKKKTTGILCNMFRSLLALSPEDVLPAVYLCTNRIAPDHKNKVRNLRIGAMMKTVLPSLAQAVVLNSSVISPECFPEHLKRKLQVISNAIVEAYDIVPNLDMLIPALLSKGMDFSPSTLMVLPGMPIPPILARITNGTSEVLKALQGRAFTCEYKSIVVVDLNLFHVTTTFSSEIFRYDGQRAQIHKQIDGTVRVFSRNLSEVTFMFPDLVTTIQELCKPAATTFILDAEVVAVDRKNCNRLMPFQHLSSRERGSKDSSVNVDNIKVDICIFVFDIMFYKGEQLLTIPLRQRRRYLKDLLPEEKYGFLEFAKEITVEEDKASVSDAETVARVKYFLEEACASSCEGIMVKSLDVDAGYAASKRTDSWLKVKRDYIEGLGDSLDLVPIGGWHGNGRKAKWYSPFLMACYDPDKEDFQSVCRVMSGFSDSFYAEMKAYFSGDKILPRKPSYYRTDEIPDVWFSPELVWEVRGAELTVSPVHHAAIGLAHPSRGISMRFPRYVRTLEDRRPEDCSTAADIANMFRSQPRRQEVASMLD